MPHRRQRFTVMDFPKFFFRSEDAAWLRARTRWIVKADTTGESHMQNISAIASETVLAIGPRISLQSMGEGEGGVLLRLDTGEMYTVNDTTLEFLQLVDGKRSVGSIVSSLLDMFEIDEETLLADMLSIAQELGGESLVVAA